MLSRVAEGEERAGAVARGTTAVILATAPAADGGPAAALAWEGETVLGRLLEQVSGLGVRHLHVITRQGWASALATSATGSASATVHESEHVAGDLRAVAAIARRARGPVLVTSGDIVTQREVLAGLLADPRLGTAALSTMRPYARPYAFRTRARAGRILAAASPYHAVRVPNATFLGVLKIGEPDLECLGELAERLAGLTEGRLPPGWEEELAAKAGRWRRWLAVQAIIRAGAEPPPAEERDNLRLPPEDEAEFASRIALAQREVTALLLVGLVRAGVPVGISRLRGLFWARPLSHAAIVEAREHIADHDEERALLDSAVKSNDGFFTTFFVSPYSKYIARWAARRGLTPNGVTLISLGVGAAAAAGFATGGRAGLVVGAVLLQAAFTLDCVDGQLARYTRTFTKFGAWLDSVFDRTKEYLVFAGLAVGASRAGDPVWGLAAAALALQTTRHTIDFSYPAVRRMKLALIEQPPLEQPLDGSRRGAAQTQGRAAVSKPPRRGLGVRLRAAWRAGDHSRHVVWVKKVIAFPIGERFAAISVTAALFSPRTTFMVLLAWGGFAAVYSLSGRILRSLTSAAVLAPAAAAAVAEHAQVLRAYRDDGPVAVALGRVLARVGGPPAIALALLAALPLLAAVAVAGAGASHALVAAAVGWAVLAGGLSSGRPLTDGMRWLVPPVLRALEYAGLIWIAAVAGPSSLPAAFALLCAIAYHHYDIVYGRRHRGRVPPQGLQRLGGGWDGRLLLACAALLGGALPTALFVAAAVLAILFVGESVVEWSRVEQSRAPDDEEFDDEEAEAI